MKKREKIRAAAELTAREEAAAARRAEQAANREALAMAARIAKELGGEPMTDQKIFDYFGVSDYGERLDDDVLDRAMGYLSDTVAPELSADNEREVAELADWCARAAALDPRVDR